MVSDRLAGSSTIRRRAPIVGAEDTAIAFLRRLDLAQVHLHCGVLGPKGGGVR